MNKKAIQKLQQMLDWNDRLGSDEKDEIKNVILLLKVEENLSYTNTVKALKKALDNQLTSTKQILNLIDNHIEYLKTSEGDELPSITIENLKGILNRYFNKK